jgi:hypothetical protein
MGKVILVRPVHDLALELENVVVMAQLYRMKSPKGTLSESTRINQTLKSGIVAVAGL